MRYTFTLILALVAVWMTLSGYFKPMLLTLGGISIGFVVWLCHRMKIMDVETVPYAKIPRTLVYIGWLFAEIVKANVQVVKAVLNPNLEVSPTLVKVPAPQKSDLGAALFANSITLTPGTVSVDMDCDDILVHALLSEMSDPNDFKDMGERSAWAMGETRSLSKINSEFKDKSKPRLNEEAN